MRTFLAFKWRCTSSTLIAWLAAAPLLGQAALSGRVEFRSVPISDLYTENFYSYRPPTTLSPAGASPTAVVYLEDREGKLDPAEHTAPAAIDQRNEAFVPHILAIQTGTRVDFPNSDDIYHNVFSLSSTKRFDLGRYPRGQSRSVVFDEEGLVRVFCEIHSHMSAYILVLPHPYFAVTDESGAYEIKGIPPGNYGVVVWNDRFRPIRRFIEISAGERKRLEFVLDQPR